MKRINLDKGKIKPSNFVRQIKIKINEQDCELKKPEVSSR